MLTISSPFSGNFPIGNDKPLVIFAGPCVIEGRRQAIESALAIRELCLTEKMACVYKSSFDKANRSSMQSYRGPGLKKGLEILAEVREKTGLPILTDVHTPEQAPVVADVADILQLPAFLCRQTDLILAVAATGKPVNIKKGQFQAPEDMVNVLAKARSTGNDSILLCERGSCFGYHNLVVDMRSLEIMKSFGAPVVFDATHSTQYPGGQGTCSGGERKFVPALARAAVAVGIAALFMEVHPDPDHAPCDGANMLALKDLPALLRQVKELDAIAKGES